MVGKQSCYNSSWDDPRNASFQHRLTHRVRTRSDPHFSQEYTGAHYDRARGVSHETALNQSGRGFHGTHAVNTNIRRWRGGPVYPLNPHKTAIGTGNGVAASRRYYHGRSSSSIPTESSVDKNFQSQNVQGFYEGPKSTRYYSDDARLYHNLGLGQCADYPNSSTTSSSDNWRINNTPSRKSGAAKQINPQNTPDATSRKQASLPSTPQKSPQESCVLWVGGLSPRTLGSDLIPTLFSECGEIKSYKSLSARSCAFVE